MTTDQRSDRSGPTAGATPEQRDVARRRDGMVVVWWGFFDWLAVVSWKMLLLVSLLGLILAGMLSHPTPATVLAARHVLLLIVASFIIKVVAGGKRRADLTATEATKRADTEQLERTVVEARMEALQAQIEPHFLFNTLASIDQLIQTDPPRASRMQQSLIRYLRSALPQMRDGRRPSLGQQVNLCSAFLEIMSVRMEGRLQSVVNVPEGLKSAVFPSMMLQTLVENAIKHGLEPKPEGGRIEIGAEIVDGQLAVHVLDNGIGFMPKAEGGVGLANVRDRLQALYNGSAELIITVPYGGGHLRHDQSALRDVALTRSVTPDALPACPCPYHPPDRTNAKMQPARALRRRRRRRTPDARPDHRPPEGSVAGARDRRRGSNGREAVTMVQSLEPDIVFLDISMPGMTASRPPEHWLARCMSSSSPRTTNTRSAPSNMARRLSAEASGTRAGGADLRAPARAAEASAGSDEGACRSYRSDSGPAASSPRLHALGAGQRGRQYTDDSD